MRKVLSLLLMLSLLLTLSVGTAAAGTTLKIDAPETLPAVGQTFTVRVSIAGNPGLCAAQYTLAFDDAVVACQRVKLGSVLGEMVSATNAGGETGAIVACAATEPQTGDGLMSEYTFIVLQSGDPAFTLTDGLFADGSGKNIATNVELPKSKDQGGATPGGKDIGTEPEPAAEPISNPQDAATPCFSDVPESYWGYGYIEKAAALKLITGNPDGTFLPNKEMTRAEFVTVLYRLSGDAPVAADAGFADVAADAWYRDAVNWAAAKGYATGDGVRFNPNGKITRQEVVTILCRYDGGPDGIESMVIAMSDPLTPYTDKDSVAAWAAGAMRWAIYGGIMNGTSGTTLTPGGTATRAQAAAIFVRYAEK